MFDKIFDPKNIAVIGASDKEGSVGRALMKNLTDPAFAGRIFPVNPKRDKVGGLPAYASVRDISEPVDLAVIATPAATVPGVLAECGQAQVAGAVIISAGFSEAGPAGQKLAAEVRQIAEQYNIRVIGPNCLGFIRPDRHLNTTFASQPVLPGRLALISQSGAMGTALLDWSADNNVGFRYFVSIGSMLDIGFCDLIEYFENDPEINAILVYMESLADADRFMAAARTFSSSKPIVVLKVGRSSQGAQAAKSHTGSLTGNDSVFDAAFAKAGVIRVNTSLELFDTGKLLAAQPIPGQGRLTIITNAGGPGIIATDALAGGGGELAALSATGQAELDKVLPPAWSHGNPVDILGDASPERYQAALRICLREKDNDAVLLILTPQAMTDPTAVATALVETAQGSAKTILAVWMGGRTVSAGQHILEQGGIPVYRQPEDAIASFINVSRYARKKSDIRAITPLAPTRPAGNGRRVIERALTEGRAALTEAEAKILLADYGIPLVKNAIATSADEASRLAAGIGFPLAMKVLSPDILHKTDVGGVALGVDSPDSAHKAFTGIMTAVRQQAPSVRLDGVIMEGMVNKEFELLLGAKKDPIFGPVIVFGRGGVEVEIYRDTAMALPPLDMKAAEQLIARTSISRLLAGYRGRPGVDMTALQELICRFAQLVADFPEISEIDINPLAIDTYGAVVLDAKAVIG